MKAIGFNQPRSIDDVHALEDIQLDLPSPGPRDLLVSVQAVSVNPIDTKLRQRPLEQPGHRVLGFDAAGVVEAVGSEVTAFQKGDRVWYAGAVQRQGSNAEHQCVDERLVARKPDSLGMQEAAALPLTALTAWEALEDQMGFRPGECEGKTLLVIGGAGGVGSIAIQLAAKHFGLRVIATAGRETSANWCEAMGAHALVDYRQPIAEQLEKLGVPQVDGIFITQNLDDYWQMACQVIAPLGNICAIVDARGPLDLNPLKPKSARFSWEFMFTRAMFAQDMQRQGDILKQLSELVDAGTIQTTLSEGLGPINADNLKAAHKRLEEGNTIGKLVLAGWE
ncbi:zinc-binding alcohol dehydrogenase family protein [Alcanivorax sp. S6407]|uniref:zinc-binding alcohol dehydrogenase family protein n=1 Tax=Alcanivorax sp. S6407 TaxID=2926424 RepID=UPI001FF1DC60|nr:zinc-binding alcohol dehydrogenase family protein [Alcanivorax sp. S6407]MCK0154084.1 zinc-binding alcohol dehydrogenase family protein [Alcanivorax sp. S6407]